MNLAQFQAWLNARGARIDVDGKGGPRTRQAVLDVFSNTNAPAITPQDEIHFAARLGGTVRQLRAVSKVESSGGGYNDDGQPKALYERHYAWRRLRLNIPFLSNPAPGGYTIDADRDGINDSWEKVADMALRNPIVAFESASFGKFQIMGAWGIKLGYANAIEFAYSMVKGERGHYEALVRYIEIFGLKQAFQSLSTDPNACKAFALGYNGPAYWKASPPYNERLAAAMR